MRDLLPNLTCFAALWAAACAPATIVTDGRWTGPDTGFEDDDSAEPCAEETYYWDRDGDGYGDERVQSCEQEDGMVEVEGDCDDDDGGINPGAEEQCNDLDDNCDGEGDPRNCEESDGGFDPEVSLTDADLKLWSEQAGYDAGRRFEDGDIDGDGTNDLVIGAMWANGGLGGAFLVPGPITESQPLADAGFWIAGGQGSYEGGRSIGIDEVSGDGYDDIFLGAPDATTIDVTILFGPVTGDLTFSDAEINLTCSQAIECGHGGSLADINGDGVGDAIIGAAEEHNGGTNSGSLYLMYGPLTAVSGTVQDNANAELRGESAGLETGRKLAAGGDANGDGVGDIIATATYDNTGGVNAGAVYVVYGPVSGTVSFSAADGKWLGESSGDYAGEAITMGDIDGDGRSDVIIGSYLHGGQAGATYVAFGPATGIVSMGDADIVVRGERGDNLGTAVSAGDADGDGIDDLLLGAGSDSRGGTSAGAAFLFYGGFTGSYVSDDAASIFIGEDRGNGAGSGTHLADLDDDGHDEVIVGSPTERTGGSGAGAMYLLAGDW